MANLPKKPTVAKTVWGNVRKIQYLRDISDDDLALMLECTTKTLRNYDHNPENIALKTIQLFCINADISAEVLLI